MGQVFSEHGTLLGRTASQWQLYYLGEVAQVHKLSSLAAGAGGLQ